MIRSRVAHHAPGILVVGIARRGIRLRAPTWRPRAALCAAAAAPEPAWDTHTAAHATHANVAQLLACTDNFVFDCDGVLYTPEGAIDGAAGIIIVHKKRSSRCVRCHDLFLMSDRLRVVAVALASLRAAGKGCFFVTNNAAATRVELQAKLRSKGIEADVSEIFGAGLPCNIRREGRAIPCNWGVIPCRIRRKGE